MIKELIKLRSLQGVAAVLMAVVTVTSVGISSVGAIDADPGERYRAEQLPQDSQMQLRSQTLQIEPGEQFEAECPPTITCIVVPAAYQMNGNDPGNFGNYSKANRPHDMKIDSIVTHDTEGDLESVLELFQNPLAYVSSHYVIDTDGTVYQMVPTKDVAWHAGNWRYNSHSIGIEHVGFASQSGGYTDAMYKSSAELVKWLSNKFDIPKDRQHALLAHDNVPAPSTGRIGNMHVDPGPYWNWQQHATYAGLPMYSNIGLSDKFVTVAPLWSKNKQEVTGCWPTEELCVPATRESTNFAYLRTNPDKNAALISDPVAGAGSTHISNGNARVFYGQTFAVADTKLKSEGVWYKIWVNGTTGWLLSPWTAPTAFPAKSGGRYVTSKNGQATAPVYGAAIPKLEEYPDDFDPPAGAISNPTPLGGYTVNTGQRYRVIEGPMKASYFYDWTIDNSLPYEETNFMGEDNYYLIQYGNRQYFVNANDVEVKS